jgi:isochorismate synthase
MSDLTDFSSTRSDPAAETLLLALRPSTPLFFASPRHTLLASDSVALPPGITPLTSRVIHALNSARDAGAPAPAVVGAIPFDVSQPAALGLTPTLRRAGPLPPSAIPKRRMRCTRREAPAGSDYAAAVGEAVRRIRRGEIDKVVLARTLELLSDHPVELPHLLAGLTARNPLGYNFSVALGGGRTLLGASPELLVRREHGVLLANPLAGSIPRAPHDPAEDQRRAAALLKSRKDLEEHRVVVDAVAQALRPLCPQLQVPAKPSLMHTPTMWHLSTVVTGPTEADALTLALALHPTPAVCGFPRSRAHELIRQLEPFERGFYAGAFGWTDASGDGEWVVSIRCAELSGQRRLRLFAGAGIVGESDPSLELAETAAKLRTMLDALGLSHDIAEAVAAEALS